MKIFFVWLFCVFLSYFCNIFCFCQVHFISVLYCARFCMECSLGISNFLEEISGLSHSIAFLYFFALITEEGFLISPCYFLELWIQEYLSFSPLPLVLFFSQLFVRPLQTTILHFCIYFSWGWLQCYKPLSIALQALCLSDLIPWIYFSLPLQIIRDLV